MTCACNPQMRAVTSNQRSRGARSIRPWAPSRQAAACFQLSSAAATGARVVSRRMRTRYATAAFWMFAGTMHFVIPKTYEATMPKQLKQWKRELVIASGVAEFAGGAGVLPEQTRMPARWLLLATTAAVFPANVHMAVNAKDFKKVPESLLWARLPLQLLIGWFTWRGTR